MGIKIFHQADVVQGDFEELHSALMALDPEIEVVLSPVDGHQNVMEWALPVALFVVCSAPAVKFMEGFFGAAGEDAYKAVKKALEASFSRAKEKGLIWSKPGGSPINPPPMSIQFPLSFGSIKFVFPYEMEKADFDDATNKLNALLIRLVDTLLWYEQQFELLADNYQELHGPGFPIEEQRMHQIHFSNQLALGTWVFVPAAGEWIKAH